MNMPYRVIVTNLEEDKATDCSKFWLPQAHFPSPNALLRKYLRKKFNFWEICDPSWEPENISQL